MTRHSQTSFFAAPHFSRLFLAASSLARVCKNIPFGRSCTCLQKYSTPTDLMNVAKDLCCLSMGHAMFETKQRCFKSACFFFQRCVLLGNALESFWLPGSLSRSSRPGSYCSKSCVFRKRIVAVWLLVPFWAVLVDSGRRGLPYRRIVVNASVDRGPSSIDRGA